MLNSHLNESNESPVSMRKPTRYNISELGRQENRFRNFIRNFLLDLMFLLAFHITVTNVICIYDPN